MILALPAAEKYVHSKRVYWYCRVLNAFKDALLTFCCHAGVGRCSESR